MRTGFALVLPVFVFIGALAHASDEFYWDNSDGFVAAESCQVQPTKTLQFQISRASVLLDEKGDRSLKTVDGTIVKTVDSLKSITKNGVVYKPVRVVGIPNESDLAGKKEYAGRGDPGFLNTSDFAGLEKFEVMITRNAHSRAVPSVEKIGNVKLVGSIWRVAVSNGQYLNFVCNGHTYTAFDILVEEAGTPVARVGVANDHTTIFASIDTREVGAAPKVEKPAPPVVEKPAPAPVAPAPIAIPLPRTRPDSAPKPNTGVADNSKPAPNPAPAPDTKNYAGQTCRRSDTDSIKCMICVIQGEARLSSQPGMMAVAQVMMQRYENKSYPHSLCKIANEPGQFIGNRSGMSITTNRKAVAAMTAVAHEAMDKGGNGYLGFRTCTYAQQFNDSRRGTPIAGNCFRKTGFYDDMLNGTPTDVAIDNRPRYDNLVQVASEEQLELINQVPASLLSID